MALKRGLRPGNPPGSCHALSGSRMSLLGKHTWVRSACGPRRTLAFAPSEIGLEPKEA